MTQLVIDDLLRNRLHEFAEPLELCAPDGRVLGRFIPALDPAHYNLSPQVSAEELERRSASPSREYTTAEVLACLERLGLPNVA